MKVQDFISDLTLSEAIKEAAKTVELGDARYYFYIKADSGIYDVKIDIVNKQPLDWEARKLNGWMAANIVYQDKDGYIIYDQQIMPKSKFKELSNNLPDNYISFEDADQIEY